MILRSASASPYEATFGFSRAVRVGDQILVSGTAPIEEDGSSTPGDAGEQTKRCLAIIVAAIEELGGSVGGVVRTRMYITDPGNAALVGEMHGKVFGEAPPAATMVVVSRLLRPEWRVEIEAQAVVAVHD